MSAEQFADATIAYQQQLEQLRDYAYDGLDDDVMAQLEEDLEKARAAMWAAWMEHGTETA